MLNRLEEVLKKESNLEQAKILQKFFKTNKGEYGEGDIFLGIKVPVLRKISKEFKLELNDIEKLLNSKIHEKRLIGLFILILKYNQAKKEVDEKIKRQIFEFYLKNSKQINNWDLVDLSAPNIVGDWLLDKNKYREILYKLVKSDNLWEKRIAVVSTFTFIRAGEFEETLNIAGKLLRDKHDLIHKAVGWMLREIGKRNQELLEDFTKNNYKEMPRTTLRYAIEKFEEEKRKKFLKGEWD